MEEWEKKIEETRSRLQGMAGSRKSFSIALGDSPDGEFCLQDKDLENSIHIMGATREGKSKQLQNIFRQLLLSEVGGCLIDPHGYLYNDLVADCSYLSSRQSEIQNRVILFDPADEEYIVGFNALESIEGLDIDMQVLSRMYATLKSRGKDDFDEFPTAKVWLQNIFTPLIEKHLTLLEARYMINRGDKSKDIIRSIVSGTEIELIADDWEWYFSVPKRMQYEELRSSVNLLRNFVTNRRMELIFGRRNRVLNLRHIMDEGKILLVNLGGVKLLKDIPRLMGTLLVNEFLLTARTRPEGSSPFFFAIDEFENYVTQDIGEILDQTHKFGLRLILAHHSLEQIREENRKVLAAVMQNAKIKLVYGGLTYDDSEILAKEMFTYSGEGGIDPMKIKRVQESPYIEPHETTRPVEGKTETTGTSSTDQSGGAFFLQTSDSAIPIDPLFLSEKVVRKAATEGSQSSYGKADGRVHLETLSRVIVPFVEQRLKWYVSNVQFSSVEEQVHEIVRQLKNLPQQVCAVKVGKAPVVVIKSTFVERYHRLKNEVRDFSRELNSKSPYHMTKAEAQKERERITEELLGKTPERTDDFEEDDERFQ